MYKDRIFFLKIIEYLLYITLKHASKVGESSSEAIQEVQNLLIAIPSRH